ncbi:START domain [Sparganum proliferum]
MPRSKTNRPEKRKSTLALPCSINLAEVGPELVPQSDKQDGSPNTQCTSDSVNHFLMLAWTCDLHSFYEIYNEQVRDLLTTSSGRTNLRVREHPEDGPYVENLSKHKVESFEDFQSLLEQGIDSSERAQLDRSARHLSETKSINKSLCTLSIVIRRLAELSKEDPIDISLTSLSSTSSQGRISRRRTGYVPYRDSKLTWLLRDSLGGNSKTTVIATISPSSASLRETMNVLRFSQCIKMIKNYPMRNEDPKAAYIRKLLQEIDRLRVEVEGCRKSATDIGYEDMGSCGFLRGGQTPVIQGVLVSASIPCYPPACLAGSSSVEVMTSTQGMGGHL